MKTTKLFGAFLLIFAVAFLSTLESCKNDNNTDTSSNTVTKTGLLTSSGWINTSFEVISNGSAADMFMFLDECDKDDKMIFSTDKTITEDAGALKCDANDPQTVSAGTWAFNADETKLEITDDGDLILFDVVTLTSTTMEIAVTEYDSLLQKDITYKMGYTH